MHVFVRVGGPAVAIASLLFFLYAIDLYPPLLLGSQTPRDALDRDGVVDFAIVDVRGADTFASHGALGVPRSRVLVGSPPVALSVAVSVSGELAGLHMWSNKIKLSSSVQFLTEYPHGWEVLDTVHAGAALTHRPGAGSAAFRPGIPTVMTFHNVPLLPACDGVLFVGPHSTTGAAIIGGLFNSVLVTPRYLTLAMADSRHLLDRLQSHSGGGATQLTLHSPTDDPQLASSSAYTCAGVLRAARLQVDGECAAVANLLEVKVYLWETEVLRLGQMNQLHSPRVRLSTSMMAVVECVCASHGAAITVAGMRLDRTAFCNTRQLVDNSLVDHTISLPWSLVAPMIVLTKSEDNIARALVINSVSYTVQVVRYSLFFFFVIGAILWYLRDRLAPMPSLVFENDGLNKLAQLHLYLEIKLIVAATALFAAFNITAYTHGHDGHSYDLYERFSFNVQGSVVLAIATAVVYASWTVQNPRYSRGASIELVDLVLLSSCRSYFVSSLISVFVEHSAMLCSSGVTLHVLSTSVWMWNIRTYIDVILRVCGYTYMTAYVRQVVLRSSDAPEDKPRAWTIALCAVTAVHVIYSIVVDMMDRTIGVTTVILPAHGLSLSMLVYTLLLFEAIETAKQRHMVADFVRANVS